MPGSVASRTAPLLVKPAWVFERLAMTRVFDASWYLPSAQRQPLVEFEQAHIPSARFFDIDEVSDKSIPLPHMLPTPQHFADFVGTKNGVSNADHVIVYDTKGIWSACRVYWTFRAFGHRNVSILDGGFPAWRASGLPTESGPAPAVAPATYIPSPQPSLIATLADVRGVIGALRNGDTPAIVDARPRGRFEGKDPEPRAGLSSGHMPHSVNVPFNEVLTADGQSFRPVDELRRIFEANGVMRDRNVIFSCGSGVTACIVQAAAELAGYDKLRVYDGSWSEYAAQKDAVIIKV